MTRDQTPNWHDTVFFGLHYDLHANAQDVDLGGKLTVEHLRERLAEVGPDWVQCDGKGHPGYTSWPATVGSPAPGLALDMLALWRDATRDLGIRLGVHYSGVWDTRALELHPDWGVVHADGTLDPHATCRLSGYEAELMVPQLLELVDRYGVDGFWVDGDNWASRPCWCERCRAEFVRRTQLEPIPLEAGKSHWDAWLAFHRALFEEYVVRYAKAVHARDPACLVCSSWLYSVRQPDPVQTGVDYLSGDYDYSWGGIRASSEGRILDSRRRDGHPLSWDLMAWSFARPGLMNPEGPGLPWATKPALHLKQEAAEVLALGGAIMLYDQPRRDGRLIGWHGAVLAEVAAFCRERQAVCFGTRSASQVAVLHVPSSLYRHNTPLYNNAPLPVEGALHLLLETGRSADLLTPEGLEAVLEDYLLLVVPEMGGLESGTLRALETFARGGGTLLMSGAHLVAESPDLVGATSLAPPLEAEAHLETDGRTVPVSGPWARPRLEGDTQGWAQRLCGQEPALDGVSRGPGTSGTGGPVAAR